MKFIIFPLGELQSVEMLNNNKEMCMLGELWRIFYSSMLNEMELMLDASELFCVTSF